jgi:dihydrofolate reductase
MRKVITGAFVSLDGMMQAPGGPEEDPSGGFKFGGWVVPFTDEVFRQAISGLFEAPFDLLLGRKTYEIFSRVLALSERRRSHRQALQRGHQNVATQKDTPLSWKQSVALSDAAADVARLKEGDGPNLITQGSSDLIQTLLANELVDEFRIFTFPLILGRGKRLFGVDAKPVR